MDRNHSSRTSSESGAHRSIAEDADAAMRDLLARPLSPDDLREQTAAVAQQMHEQRHETRSLMIVEMGVERLALPAEAVIRVTQEAPIHRIPHRSNDVFHGICSIDGELLLTMALEKLLQLPTAGTKPADAETDARAAGRRRTVVIGEERAPWAFAVDAVLVVDRFDLDTFLALPVTVERALVHYAEGIVPFEKGHAAILDAARLQAGFQGAMA